MRVVTHLRAHYDYVPCPPGTPITDADIKSGRVMRKSESDPWLMRVKKTRETHNLTGISEGEICRHIIGMAMPSQGYQRLTRKAAVADYLAKHNGRAMLFDGVDVKHFEVHDDGAPDEALFRATASQYTDVTHPGTGAPLLTAQLIDDLVALYKEPATEADHVDHLHGRFGVPKGA